MKERALHLSTNTCLTVTCKTIYQVLLMYCCCCCYATASAILLLLWLALYCCCSCWSGLYTAVVIAAAQKIGRSVEQ
ncbi:hypothetical protein SOVF_006650 [Spinacia oleracea]|nr:hypothetical protein SOVF_006650 [Spinacia oleracea]